MFKRSVLIVLGAVLYAVNLNTFVYSANLFPGGFAGIALLITRSTEKFARISIPYSAVYLLLNAFPVYIRKRLDFRVSAYSVKHAQGIDIQYIKVLL